MPNPVAAATSVATVPVAAIKAHPVVWLVALTLVAVVAIRYRTTIIGWFSKVPVAGGRVQTFARS